MFNAIFKRIRSAGLEIFIETIGAGACSLSLYMVARHSSNHDFNQVNVQFSMCLILVQARLTRSTKEKMIGEKVYREVHKQMPVMQNPWLEDQLISVFSQYSESNSIATADRFGGH